MISAGKLRHRLELQNFGEVADEYNELIKDYATFATVSGLIEPLTGRELLEAKQLESRVTHRITIRSRTDMKPIHRILHNTRTFEVISVLDLEERRRKMLIMCIEKVA